MFHKKLGLVVGVLVLLLIVTACAQAEEGQQNTVDSFMHIHGLSYDQKEPYHLYMSTHHGLIQINSSNQWKWIGEPEHRHDLMGFTVQNEDTMISSGHPVDGSKLKNPLGVVISKDDGETWEPIALHGQVDFHVFEVNAGDPSVLYGINSHGDNAGFYKSLDGGFNWDKIDTEGLPSDLMTVYSLVSDPENPQSLLAATQNGILASTDEGETWTQQKNNQTFSSAKGVIHESGKIVAYFLVDNEGLMVSNDFGETWTSLNLKLGEDAAMHIAIHPSQEGVYVVGTYNEHVLLTMDGGESWTPLAENGIPLE